MTPGGQLIPYERTRGTLYDLARLAEIDSCRSRILCVSDRTLYMLANLASLDIAFRSRYAVELTEVGYFPVTEEDAENELYLDVVNRFQLEVIDMTCDIEAGLEAIADAIVTAGGSGGGGGCGAYPSPVLNCIVDLDNETLLGPDDMTAGNPGTDPPPEGWSTWEEYFDYKCKAAKFIWDLERKHMVMLRNFEGAALVASIVGPTAAGLLGVLPAAMTPAGFAVFVASVVAIGVVAGASWIYMDQMIDWWDDNEDEIICSLYESGTSVGAVSALGNALEDALQAIIAWGALEAVAGTIAGLLGAGFAELAGNGIVAPLFEATVAVANFDYDCDGCESSGDYGCESFEFGILQWYPGDEEETIRWVENGNDDPGALELTMPAGEVRARAISGQWAGIVVATGDTLSGTGYIDQSVDNINIGVVVEFTDESIMGDFSVAVGEGGWYEWEETVGAGDNGKEIEFVWVEVNKALNGSERIARFDNVCVLEA